MSNGALREAGMVLKSNYSGPMDLLLKILKVSALLLFLFVLVVLCAPTLKGAFIIIHFATTLKAWMMVQMVFLGFVLAAHLRVGVLAQPAADRHYRLPAITGCTPAIKPLRC